MEAFKNSAVAAVFDTYPATLKIKLLALRQLIFDTASETAGVDAIEETLKWGEPAYLTSQTKSGSTIRIDLKQSRKRHYAMYFNCQTDLVERFRTVFPNDFTYEGNRSIVFCEDDVVPIDALRCCIAMTLTYHLDKRACA